MQLIFWMCPDVEMAVELVNDRHSCGGGRQVIADLSSIGGCSKLKTCPVSTNVWSAGILGKRI